jgi:HSP20 family protein
LILSQRMDMQDNSCHTQEYIYPGAYVPLLEEKEVRNKFKCVRRKYIQVPPVDITESTNSFNVEIAIPGVSRGDFFIEADNHILSVRVLHKKPGTNFELPDSNYECFRRNITLPKNVDAEFVSAEYKAGTLSLHLPKAKHLLKKQHTRIVVY